MGAEHQQQYLVWGGDEEMGRVAEGSGPGWHSSGLVGAHRKSVVAQVQGSRVAWHSSGLVGCTGKARSLILLL